MMNRFEERLPLWLPLPINEKLKMLTAEHDEGEACLMSMLILAEIDWLGKGGHMLKEIEYVMERALDN